MVDVAVSVNPTSLIRGRFLSWFLPKTPKGLLLFWASLPFILCLLNLGVSSLKPSNSLAFMPLLLLVSAAAIYRFKMYGLGAGLCALSLLLWKEYPHLELEKQLWHIGVFFTHALSLCTMLLSFEELSALIQLLEQPLQRLTTHLNQMESELRLLKMTAEEQEKAFREEIERLKNEAEQRRIEKVKAEGYLGQLRSEIALLNTQKNTATAHERKLYEEIAHQKEQLQGQENKLLEAVKCIEEGRAYHTRLLDEKEALVIQEKLQSQQERELLQQQLNAQEEEHKKSKRNYSLLEASFQQLRLQFGEKSQLLSKTRQELFALETKLGIVEREKAAREEERGEEEAKVFEKEIALLCAEIELLEKELELSQDFISRFGD